MGMIVHTGDFKLDPTPIDGIGTDYSSFASLGKEGVLLMLSDSTNIEKEGITPSEKTVGQTFERLFRLYKDRRIVIATFASNLHRAQQVFSAAGRFNRKVVLVGRSMINNVELAMDLGYIDVPEGLIISSQEADHMPENRLVVLTTGSQGEPFSGLVLMSRGIHRMVRLGPKDLVIISATPIPGNEKLVSHTVIISRYADAGKYMNARITSMCRGTLRDELTIMLSMLKPRFFVPVHGEYRHLARHAHLARDMGVAPKNIFVMQNGDVLRFKNRTSASVDGRVQSGAGAGRRHSASENLKAAFSGREGNSLEMGMWRFR